MNEVNACVHSLTNVLYSCPFMYFMVRCITSRLRVFALNIPGFPLLPFYFYLVAIVFLLLVILSTGTVKAGLNNAVK